MVNSGQKSKNTKTTGKKSKFKFSLSDCRTMTLEDKGQIMKLWREGNKVKAIAGMVDRSMDWLNGLIPILESDKGLCDELIKAYNKTLENAGKKKNVKLRQKTTRKSRSIYRKKTRTTIQKRHSSKRRGNSSDLEKLRRYQESGT